MYKIKHKASTMNEIVFLRTCMTTVKLKLEHQYGIGDIVRIISNNDSILKSAIILSKYYKQNDGSIYYDGKPPEKLKCFPKTLTIYCKTSKSTPFKIRWFYSKTVNTIHLASGLKPDVAMNYIHSLAEYFKESTNNTKIISSDCVLVNGMSQAKYGVNLFKLSKWLEQNKKNQTYVYTPDRSASLKIYMDKGTVCVHSTGKILYMGSKNYEALMLLHQSIVDMGKEWTGVSVI